MSIRDRVSFLHDETNTLLKTKYLLDTKTDALVDRMEKKKEILVGLKETYFNAHATAQATAFLQPGEPVISRYGYGYILAHRGEDDMLQVTPLVAISYILPLFLSLFVSRSSPRLTLFLSPSPLNCRSHYRSVNHKQELGFSPKKSLTCSEHVNKASVN